MQKNIDVPKHTADNRDSMKVQVRCKNGNKVDSVYSLKKNGQSRTPDCPPDLGNKVEMTPNQGYLRTGKTVDVDASFNK